MKGLNIHHPFLVAFLLVPMIFVVGYALAWLQPNPGEVSSDMPAGLESRRYKIRHISLTSNGDDNTNPIPTLTKAEQLELMKECLTDAYDQTLSKARINDRRNLQATIIAAALFEFRTKGYVAEGE